MSHLQLVQNFFLFEFLCLIDKTFFYQPNSAQLLVEKLVGPDVNTMLYLPYSLKKSKVSLSFLIASYYIGLFKIFHAFILGM